MSEVEREREVFISKKRLVCSVLENLVQVLIFLLLSIVLSSFTIKLNVSERKRIESKKKVYEAITEATNTHTHTSTHSKGNERRSSQPLKLSIKLFSSLRDFFHTLTHTSYICSFVSLFLFSLTSNALSIISSFLLFFEDERENLITYNTTCASHIHTHTRAKFGS